MQLKSIKATDKAIPYEVTVIGTDSEETVLKRKKLPEPVAKIYIDLAEWVRELFNEPEEKIGTLSVSVNKTEEATKFTFEYNKAILDHFHQMKCKITGMEITEWQTADLEDLRAQCEENNNMNVYHNVCHQVEILKKWKELEEAVRDNYGLLSKMDYSWQMEMEFEG